MRTLGTGGRLADRVSRRALLGAAIAGGVLVSCGGAPPPTQAPAPAATPGPEGSPAPKPTSAPAAAAQGAPATVPAPVGPGSPAPAATSAVAAPPAATPPPAPAGVKVVTPVAEPPLKRVGTVSSFYWTENPPTLDPYLNVSFRSQTFAGAFYSRLLRSKKGPGLGSHAYVLEGDLAESWKVAEDGQTSTFTLRPNAKWHNKPPMNGRPVTARDVAWSFERFMKVSPQKTTFDVVADVSAPDDRTVVFKLKQSFAPFEASIGAPILWIMPREVIEADGDASKRVVGSGPFVFDKFESGVQISGRRNPDFYIANESNVDIVSPIIPDTATQMAALRAGQLDVHGGIPQTEIANLARSNPEIKLYEAPNLNIPFTYWRVDAPPFNDQRVRQAISMMQSRDDYIKVIHNGRGEYNNAIPYALSESWLNPRGPDAGPSARLFKHDPAEAKKLLDAAGWDWGKKITMIGTPGYGQVFVQAIELVHQQLKQAGLNVELKMQEYTAYIGTTFAGKFDPGTIVFGLETPFTEPHDYLFNMYHPKGTRNHAGVNDPKLTEIIEQQMRTVDKAKRKALLHDIQRYLAEQMYYPPGTAGVVTAAVQPWVKNYFYISDYGQFSEVLSKVWVDR